MAIHELLGRLGMEDKGWECELARVTHTTEIAMLATPEAAAIEVMDMTVAMPHPQPMVSYQEAFGLHDISAKEAFGALVDYFGVPEVQMMPLSVDPQDPGALVGRPVVPELALVQRFIGPMGKDEIYGPLGLHNQVILEGQFAFAARNNGTIELAVWRPFEKDDSFPPIGSANIYTMPAY